MFSRRACESQSCDRRNPPDCQLFAKGWCGFLDKEGVPKRYKSCSCFHPQNIPQIPPTSVVNSQSATEHDARRETEVEIVLLVQRGGSATPVTHLPPSQPTGDSETINQLKEELGEANTKITKLEQSIQQLEDLLNEAQVSNLEVIDQRINDRILEVLEQKIKDRFLELEVMVDHKITCRITKQERKMKIDEEKRIVQSQPIYEKQQKLMELESKVKENANRTTAAVNNAVIQW